MDGIHDLGGMEGFGPIPIEGGDADFADIEAWEQRMWALNSQMQVDGVTIDWFRHGIERMVPADYLSFAYFNKWCANYLMLLLDNGVISMEDVRRGTTGDRSAPAPAPTLGDVLATVRKSNRSFAVDQEQPPAFMPGEPVRTLAHIRSDHTRLPRYARGVEGTILTHHGSHLLPDEGAKGRHAGTHLYSVCFKATDLWGSDANPRDTVTLDLWEPYLVPA